MEQARGNELATPGLLQPLSLVASGKVTAEAQFQQVTFNIDDDQVFVSPTLWRWNDRGQSMKEAVRTLDNLSCEEKGTCKLLFKFWVSTSPLVMGLMPGAIIGLLFGLLVPRRTFERARIFPSGPSTSRF